MKLFRWGGVSHHVSVPHPDGVLDAYLPHEETVHPPEAELYELDVFFLHVLDKALVYPRGKVSQRSNLALNSWLSNDVVILDAIEQLGQAPESVGLDRVQHRLRELAGVHTALDVWSVIYIPRKTCQNGVTRSLIPWT